MMMRGRKLRVKEGERAGELVSCDRVTKKRVKTKRERKGSGKWFYFIFNMYSYLVGGSGNHPTKNIISVTRPKPEKYKYSKSYPSIYV